VKIGVFADIHGNGSAFDRIYESLEKESCDRLFFLGDICGYYYDQNRIIEILNEIPNLTSILGNHDALFLEALDNRDLAKSYLDRYGKSNEFLMESITPESIEFLKKMPTHFKDHDLGIAAYHGSPWDPLGEYVYPDSAPARFAELPFKLVLLGHTHYPMDVHTDNGRIVNPGSVGQPRDGGWPSYAVYDDDIRNLEIKRIPFDVDRLVKEIESRHECNPYLIDILRRIGT
jgi:putative phosphoesterase